MASTPVRSELQTKSGSKPTTAFGDFLRQEFESLFGDRQTREESQQFSNQPALSGLQLQSQASTNDLAGQANLLTSVQRNSAALSGQSAQAASQRLINQAKALSDVGAGARGSSATMQGPGAFFNNFAVDFNGYQRLDPSRLNQWNYQRQQALESTGMFGRMNADIDAYRAQQVGNAQAAIQERLASSDRYNQGLLSAQQFQQQSGLQRAQLAAQREIAQIGAQGSILASLFGSVGAGSPNYRYWS